MEARLHDVAREAGVHPSTVSRALDPLKSAMVKEATRKRIIEVAGRLGYRPHMVARSLQQGRTATVGVITADLGNTWVTPIIHGVAASIETDGMLPFIAETQEDLKRLMNIVDHMLARRVDAIVVIAARDGAADILESAARLVPVVIAARALTGSHLPYVVHDDRQGGRLVAEHLWQLGHKRVAQLQGPTEVASFPRRAEGFSYYSAELGMDEVPLSLRAARSKISDGQHLMKALLEQSAPLPTAVFAHNDLMAIGALTAIRDAGLQVPEDISLIGYNDMPVVGHLTPALTTVRYPGLDVGVAAGQMVVRLLSGETPPDVTLGSILVPRASTRTV